jgi:hypothetical protein
LGNEWKYADKWPTLTFEGFQAKLLVNNKRLVDPPLLIILSRPCARSYEARESALVHALNFVDDVCAYHIGDLHYTELIMRDIVRWAIRSHPGM